MSEQGLRCIILRSRWTAPSISHQKDELEQYVLNEGSGERAREETTGSTLWPISGGLFG